MLEARAVLVTRVMCDASGDEQTTNFGHSAKRFCRWFRGTSTVLNASAGH